MKIKNNKIILSDKENIAFISQFKKGVLNQLHKEKMLTSMQLNELFKKIDQ